MAHSHENYTQYCRNIVKSLSHEPRASRVKSKMKETSCIDQKNSGRAQLNRIQMLDEDMIMKNLAEGEISVVDICPEKC